MQVHHPLLLRSCLNSAFFFFFFAAASFAFARVFAFAAAATRFASAAPLRASFRAAADAEAAGSRARFRAFSPTKDSFGGSSVAFAAAVSEAVDKRSIVRGALVAAAPLAVSPFSCIFTRNLLAFAAAAPPPPLLLLLLLLLLLCAPLARGSRNVAPRAAST